MGHAKRDTCKTSKIWDSCVSKGESWGMEKGTVVGHAKRDSYGPSKKGQLMCHAQQGRCLVIIVETVVIVYRLLCLLII